MNYTSFVTFATLLIPTVSLGMLAPTKQFTRAVAPFIVACNKPLPQYDYKQSYDASSFSQQRWYITNKKKNHIKKPLANFTADQTVANKKDLLIAQSESEEVKRLIEQNSFLQNEIKNKLEPAQRRWERESDEAFAFYFRDICSFAGCLLVGSLPLSLLVSDLRPTEAALVLDTIMLTFCSPAIVVGIFSKASAKYYASEIRHYKSQIVSDTQLQEDMLAQIKTASTGKCDTKEEKGN